MARILPAPQATSPSHPVVPMPRPSVLASSVALVLVACGGGDTAARPRDRDDRGAEAAVAPSAAIDATLPLVRDTLRAAVVTERVPRDSDDPAIWVDPVDPARSLILGTDKGDRDGGVYAFRLDGTIDRARSVAPLARMNNVDVRQGVRTSEGGTIDVAVATERGRMALRVFALPAMRPIDGGGIPVFGSDSSRAPMGVALYRRARDGALFAIVGGKGGPATDYLEQYRLTLAGGRATARLVRRFGAFSGTKEIEAIVADDATGMVFYSDETVGVRRYHADPDSGSRELALFATRGVVGDHEGLAIRATSDTTGYLLLSDQQGRRLHVYRREAPHALVAVIPVDARETDGIEVSSAALGPRFPAGVLVMMSDTRRFHVYDWRDVERLMASRR